MINEYMIEDTEEEILIGEDNEELISNYILCFKKILPEFMSNEEKLEKLRKKFVSDFSKQKIMEMTKEEYVVGLGSKDTFCYRLENELGKLGDMHGATSSKFGLYYGKSGTDREEKYRFTKKFGNTLEEAFKEIKKQIISLIESGEIRDEKAISSSKISELYRGKILATYFPDKYLCIFAKEHLEYFLNKLEISFNNKENIISKQQKLLDWKENNKYAKNWSIYIFARFLYYSFDRPAEENITKKDIQRKRDKEYPREYVTEVDITIEQWKAMLKNPEIFSEENITFLKRFYLSDNHASTCFDLSIEDGVDPTTYISPVVGMAKRVTKEMALNPIYQENGKRAWWRILFWGRYREDNHFEWKLQPKLAKAMLYVFPELNKEIERNIEDKEDDKLVEGIKPLSLENIVDGFEYEHKPKEKAFPKYINGHKIYPRDKKIAINALIHANYSCEVDRKHPTFIRRNSDKNYTEPHHLVPMAYSDEFNVSLDVEENIVSLCSNCHNEIHYGKDARMLVEKLYNDRQKDLEKVGISISLEELLKIYKL